MKFDTVVLNMFSGLAFGIITASIRRMREGNIFSLFTLAGGGGGNSIPDPDGRNPSQVWTGGGGGYIILLMRGTPSQVWIGEGTSSCWQEEVPQYPILLRGVPHPTSRQGVPWGIPWSRLDGGVPSIKSWMGYPPIQGWMGSGHPVQDWMRYLSTKTGWGTPYQETDQQSEHLLRGGRCASCVHAG